MDLRSILKRTVKPDMKQNIADTKLLETIEIQLRSVLNDYKMMYPGAHIKFTVGTVDVTIDLPEPEPVMTLDYTCEEYYNKDIE